MVGLSGCFGKKYNVDYNGNKELFPGAKDAYRAGESVKLNYKSIVSESNNSFFLNGKTIKADFEEGKGYVIAFTMPENDIVINVDAQNSTVVITDSEKAAVLFFHSFDGGGPSFKVKIKDESVVTCRQARKYTVKNHDIVCGAGYTVYVSFFGLKPGKTTAIIEARSPIADNYDALYDVVVNEDLSVTVTLREQTDIRM